MPVQKVYLLNQTTPVNIPSGLVPKGAYNAGTDYAVGDSVDYNGSSYVMFVDAAAGTAPTDTTKWQVLANKGATGATGSTGAAGSNGTNGTNGIDGKTILNGAVDPTTEGVDGDFYINTTSDEIFGPKTAGVWGTGTSIVGPAGTNGTNGAGVVVGGTTGQVLAKIDATDYNTQWVNQSGGIADPGSNGILARTALNTTSARTITGTANQVTVTNGDGVSGNPTLSLPQNIDTSATPTFSSLTAGTATDVLGTALSVIRNNVAVGRIDNNASGLRVQAQNGSLQLRGTGNTGIAIDASGNAVVAGTITGANLSGTNTGDNATNSQYSGLDAAKVNKAGDTMTGNLNMGTNKLIGGTRITDVLKLQGTTDNGTLTSPAIQLLTGNNGATTALTVLNNGNVGVGTTSPTLAKLQVESSDNTTMLALSATGGNARLYMGTDSSSNALIYTQNNVDLRMGINSLPTALVIKNGGNVGIGETSPNARLQVTSGAAATIGQIIKGATSQTADLLQIQDSSANKLMVVSSGGNVGIGTTSPTNPLHVAINTVTNSPIIQAQNINTGGGAVIGIDRANNPRVAGLQYSTAGSINWVTGMVYNAGVAENGYSISTDATLANTKLYVSTAGRVGIGVSDPQAKLEIAGDIATTIGANRKLKLSSATAYWYDLQSTNDDFQIIEASDVNKVRLTIKYPNGNVGIGNTAPGAKLQVDTGAAATIGQIIKGATSQTADLLQIQDSSANKLMVVSSGGNVGIGVAAPATPLEVNGIVRADRTAVPAQYIQLDGGDGNNTALRAVAANKFLYIDNSDTSGTNLYNAIVFRNGTAGDTERMRVDANGNVGIGTTSPSEKLVISGTVKATGYKSSDGSAGVSGSFTTTDGKTITIKDGLVVSIV